MIAGNGCGADPGKRGGTLKQRRVEGVLLGKVRPSAEVDRIPGRRQLIFRLQHILGSEPEVHTLQRPETAYQQCRAAHEHHRHRELRDNENSAHA